MNKPLDPVHRRCTVIFSQRLKRSMSSLGLAAFVQFNLGSGNLVLTSEEGAAGRPQPVVLPQDVLQEPGALVSCQKVVCGQEDIIANVEKLGLAVLPIGTSEQSWQSFRVVFANGVEDRITLLTKDTIQPGPACGLLSMLWPMLREDCLIDLQRPSDEVCDRAMLWMIDNEINVSILVMTPQGIMLRANAAARRMLERENVLRRTPHGVRCVNDAQTPLFREALADCARSVPPEAEQIVFLDADASGLRVPVTLSRFWHDGRPTNLVLVMMPSPPDSRRVEKLARAGGLTHAEARVAALLQMGLSNKDAAKAAGLKEQSVSTYAKRALSKLNVTSRAEMAQMLTWQAAGGKLQ